MRLISVSKQKELIPDESIKMAFLRRPDIARLKTGEQESRWAKHLAKVNKFREFLATIPGIVMPRFPQKRRRV
jgi:hypothetical protein